jgi:hypothetical protein
MARIRIVCEAAGVDVTAGVNDSQSAQALLGELPIDAVAQRWGAEVYFTVPVQAPPENPVEHVAHGDIAYWPPGPAFCVFFGQQPVSAVNKLGEIDGDAAVFAAVEDGQAIRLEAVG